MIKTKLAVFAGTLVQSSLGETGFGSDCVYFAGISPPSAKAAVVIVSPGRAGAGGCFSCARTTPVKAKSRIVIRMVCPAYINRDSRRSVIAPSGYRDRGNTAPSRRRDPG